MKNMIIANNGSIQNIPSIPDNVKAIYKTVWEISQKKVLDLAADRGAFICQSQSLNVHLQSPTLGQLTSMHFYGWKKGLKTGMYYLRTRPAAQAIQFTVDQGLLKDAKAKVESPAATPKKAIQGTGIPTPNSSSENSPVRPAASSAPAPVDSTEQDVKSASDKTQQAAEADPEFAAALQRQKDREWEESKIMCSIENKEACLMCSG
jgi:ribonucleoside-diphosphate reductase subunit M1